MIDIFDSLQLREKQIHIHDLNRSMEQIIKNKDKQINDLRSDLEHSRKSSRDISRMAEERVTEEVRSALKKIFTDNQVDLILGVKKRVVWTPKEIEMAFSLR